MIEYVQTRLVEYVVLLILALMVLVFMLLMRLCNKKQFKLQANGMGISVVLESRESSQRSDYTSQEEEEFPLKEYDIMIEHNQRTNDQIDS